MKTGSVFENTGPVLDMFIHQSFQHHCCNYRSLFVSFSHVAALLTVAVPAAAVLFVAAVVTRRR
jgi:hypothetical protein